MAEYYAVLSKAVAGLEANGPDTRRAVYDKARNALIGQLKAIDPPLPTAEISRQRLELEEAIRRVERETASVPTGAPVKVAAASRAPMAEATAPPPPPPGPSQRQQQARQSPQDVFRRAIQDAEQREVDTPPRLERATPAPAAAKIDTSWASERIDRVPPSARPSQSFLPSQGYVEEPHGNDEPRLAPDYDYTWDQNAQPEESGDAVSPRVDARNRVDPRSARRGRRAGQRVDDHDEIERAAKPSRLPAILLLVLILVMLGGLGAIAYAQRDMISDVMAGFTASGSGGTSGTAPAPAAPDPAPTAADAGGKDTDRLLVGGEPAPSDVRTVAPGDAPAASGDAIAGQVASADAFAATDSPASAPTAGGIDADSLVAQRAILYEEPQDAGQAADGVVAINAAVTWNYVENGPNGPEIVGNVDIPDRGMKIKVAIRRNTDGTLPASHIVEVVVDTPADFPGKAVRDVPRIVFKPSEEARGQPLIGASAKVADGFFWIALSGVQSDVNANVNLLRDRLWIDLPLVYESGQRAILTFEKGTPGERVFERALTAWAG